MQGIISHSTWDMYRKTIKDFHKSVGKQKITWKKLVKNLDHYGEGFSRVFLDIELEILAGYNDSRTWPTDKLTEAGIRDQENLYLYLNRQVLEDKGHLNSNGYLDFDPGYDRFIVQGIEYKPAGDIASAMAEDNPLYVMLILKRVETHTGDEPR